jgi:HK97 family phage portal protein
MGINFFKWLRAKNGGNDSIEVSIDELFSAAQETQIRVLCWNVCVNMIANAMGRCDFRTYKDGKETFDREHYLWNYEPNGNQNSTAFIHKLIGTLYEKNEALIVENKTRSGTPSLFVADGWANGPQLPDKANEYTGVTVGDMRFKKTFRESDVNHIQLNHTRLKPVLDAVNDSYIKMVNAAMEFITWSQGQHWKVHVSSLAQGGDGWEEKFQKMITAQLKPFLTNSGAVLPEFDGYEYSNVNGSSSYQSANGDTGTLQTLITGIWNTTARAFGIPAVLVDGTVQATGDANQRFLTNVIDPLCDQLQEEIVRKRYGFDAWKRGDYIRVDSSSITHFDLFDAAASIEKLVGSGAFNINDIRKAAGQATINEPWADSFFITKNFTEMKDATTMQGE